MVRALQEQEALAAKKAATKDPYGTTCAITRSHVTVMPAPC